MITEEIIVLPHVILNLPCSHLCPIVPRTADLMKCDSAHSHLYLVS